MRAEVTEIIGRGPETPVGHIPFTPRAKKVMELSGTTTADMRTVMYPTRKQLKMNVSLTRKNHIIALPHGTWYVCRSAE